MRGWRGTKTERGGETEGDGESIWRMGGWTDMWKWRRVMGQVGQTAG